MYTKFETWAWLKAVRPQDYFSICVRPICRASLGRTLSFWAVDLLFFLWRQHGKLHEVQRQTIGFVPQISNEWLHTWCGENSVAVLVYWTHQRKDGKTDIAATWCFWEIQHQWHSIETSKKLVQVHYRMTIPLDRSWSYDVWAWPSSVSDRQIANEVVDSCWF